VSRKINAICAREGCVKPVFVRGFCKFHYGQERYAGRLPRKIGIAKNAICKIEEDGALCGKEVYANGVCNTHYNRFLKNGIFETKAQLLQKNSKLTESQILELRALWAKHLEYKRLVKETTLEAIGKKFGVSKQVVDYIIKGLIYRKIDKKYLEAAE